MGNIFSSNYNQKIKNKDIINVLEYQNSSFASFTVNNDIKTITLPNTPHINSIKIPTFTDASLANPFKQTIFQRADPTHRLEDVIDRVQYRLVGNGIVIKVLKTVAWSLDDLNWHCWFWLDKKKSRSHDQSIDYKLHKGPLPIHEYGVQCEPRLPLKCSCKLFDQNNLLIAKGDLLSFFIEQK